MRGARGGRIAVSVLVERTLLAAEGERRCENPTDHVGEPRDAVVAGSQMAAALESRTANGAVYGIAIDAKKERVAFPCAADYPSPRLS